MHLRSLLLIGLAITLACTRPTGARPDCRINLPVVITDSSIGPYVIGKALPCPVLRDTIELDPHEGIPQTVAYLPLGPDTVRAVLDSGRIFYLQPLRAAVRTREGYGIGTPLSKLLGVPGLTVLEGAEAEPTYYIQVPPHCGMSFHVTDTTAAFHEALDPIERLRRLPDSTRVSGLHVYGCSPSI